MAIAAFSIDKMEDSKIKERARVLKTKEDLLDLLNDMKKEEYGEDTHLFTIQHLNYYCNPKYEKRYTTFQIPKKKKGEFRTISAPTRALKNIQHFLNEILCTMYVPSKAVCGFVKNKSVVDNASKHVNMNYVLNIDLDNFFPSIPQVRIWWLLQQKPYSFCKDVANIIAGLCAIKQPKKDVENPKDDIKDYDYVLPQGAPTSPILANISCEHLDHKLQNLANSFGLNYSRYADDITFSSKEYVYSRRGEFWKRLRQIISDHKLTINEEKTRLLRKGVRQEVTGLTVNEKVNVVKKYVQEIRRHLNTWEKYGYAVAYKNFYPKYKIEKGHVKKGEPDLTNVISGKLLYLKMVKGESDPVYLKLDERFKLLAHEYENALTIGDITYISTSKVADFERRLKTEIQSEENKKGNTTYYFVVNDTIKSLEKIWLRGKVKEKTNTESLTSKKNVIISRNADFSHKEDLYISLCRNSENGMFYLIHNELKSSEEQQIKKLELDHILSGLVDGGKLNLDIFDQVEKEKSEEIKYEETLSIEDFENKHNCKIELSANKKIATFSIEGEKGLAYISKNINADDFQNFYISKCRKGKEKPFYLIHKKGILSIFEIIK